MGLTIQSLFLHQYGCLDVKKLNEYLEIASRLGICEEDIIYTVDGYGFSYKQMLEDINVLFLIVINLIFFTYIDLLGEWLSQEYPEAFETIEGWLDEEKDEFNPYINCLDSWFSNELDEIEIYNDEKSFKAYLKAIGKKRREGQHESTKA